MFRPLRLSPGQAIWAIAVNLRDIPATKARLEVKKLRFEFRVPNSELEIQINMKV
jgi:hypothetical protein